MRNERVGGYIYMSVRKERENEGTRAMLIIVINSERNKMRKINKKKVN